MESLIKKDSQPMYTQCTQVMLKKLAKITKLTYSHTIFKIQKEETKKKN